MTVASELKQLEQGNASLTGSASATFETLIQSANPSGKLTKLEVTNVEQVVIILI